MSGRRPVLTLKRKPDDALAELLDQGSETDPHNPHKLVQPSKAVIPDQQRLIQNLMILVSHATGERNLNPRVADQLAHECSSLTRKIANAASGNAIERD
jgi:hypothetical protein